MENKLNLKDEERRDAFSTTWSDPDNVCERLKKFKLDIYTTQVLA